MLLQGGMGGGMVGGAPRQRETMGQRVQEHMPGHHNQQASTRVGVPCLHYRVPRHVDAGFTACAKIFQLSALLWTMHVR